MDDIADTAILNLALYSVGSAFFLSQFQTAGFQTARSSPAVRPVESVVSSTAYLLISHGSRDPRPQAAMHQLAQLVRERLQPDLSPSAAPVPIKKDPIRRYQAWVSPNFRRWHPKAELSGSDLEVAESGVEAPTVAAPVAQAASMQTLVGTANLELGPCPLHQQIVEFTLRAKAAGVNQVKLVPMFLLQGVHVMEDLPAEVTEARSHLADAAEITLCRHLGSHPGLYRVMAERLSNAEADMGIIVAHGSRRPGGNKAVEATAQQLGAAVAYWSVPPDLETQVVQLMQRGVQRLTILPYFLFAGGITDAIIHRTEELAERFPSVGIRLMPPLGTSSTLADLVVELALDQPDVA